MVIVVKYVWCWLAGWRLASDTDHQVPMEEEAQHLVCQQAKHSRMVYIPHYHLEVPPPADRRDIHEGKVVEFKHYFITGMSEPNVEVGIPVVG